MNDFYVYAWLRPCGTPFYIGKGRRNRDLVLKIHNPAFMRIVAKIRRAAFEPSVVRIATGLTEDEAFAIECENIKKHGRRDNGTGILANLTDGGDGRTGAIPSASSRRKNGDSHRGMRRSIETGRKISASKIGKPRPPHVGEAVRAAKAGKPLPVEVIDKLRIIARRSGPRKHSISGLKCVTPKRDNWSAYIDLPDGRKNLGTFPTAEDAARAYDDAAYAVWGRDCYLNFPDRFAA